MGCCFWAIILRGAYLENYSLPTKFSWRFFGFYGNQLDRSSRTLCAGRRALLVALNGVSMKMAANAAAFNALKAFSSATGTFDERHARAVDAANESLGQALLYGVSLKPLTNDSVAPGQFLTKPVRKGGLSFTREELSDFPKFLPVEKANPLQVNAMQVTVETQSKSLFSLPFVSVLASESFTLKHSVISSVTPHCIQFLLDVSGSTTALHHRAFQGGDDFRGAFAYFIDPRLSNNPSGKDYSTVFSAPSGSTPGWDFCEEFRAVDPRDVDGDGRFSPRIPVCFRCLGTETLAPFRVQVKWLFLSFVRIGLPFAAEHTKVISLTRRAAQLRGVPITGVDAGQCVGSRVIIERSRLPLVVLPLILPR